MGPCVRAFSLFLSLSFSLLFFLLSLSLSFSPFHFFLSSRASLKRGQTFVRSRATLNRPRWRFYGIFCDVRCPRGARVYCYVRALQCAFRTRYLHHERRRRNDTPGRAACFYGAPREVHVKGDYGNLLRLTCLLSESRINVYSVTRCDIVGCKGMKEIVFI